MTTYEIDILKGALLSVERQELAFFEALPDQDFTPSLDCERNFHSLAKKRKSFVWQATKTIPRRVGIVLVAVLVTFCLMMSISAIRTPIVNFFVDIFESFISISVDGGAPKEIKEVYLPTYTPQGFTQDSLTNDGFHIQAMWKNEDGNTLVFTQDILNSSYEKTLDNAVSGYEKTSVGEKDLYYTQKYDQYVFVWASEEYIFLIKCPPMLTFDEAEKIVLSVSVTE